MEEEVKNIDQSVLAKDLADKIIYDFVDCFLVKPLDPIKVTKEFTKPVSDKKPVKDENGIEAVDFEKTETEVKEVDSDFRRGIVLKVPTSYVSMCADTSHPTHLPQIETGNVVVFRENAGMFFDLLKDSRMVRIYDIVAIEK